MMHNAQWGWFVLANPAPLTPLSEDLVHCLYLLNTLVKFASWN